MKIKFFTLIFIYIFSWQVSECQEKTELLDSFINNPLLKHAGLSLSVKDMSGKKIVKYNDHQSLTPASTLKVVTTASALELLGQNYTYPTTLSWDIENPSRLIICGSGDPTLGSTFLDSKDVLKEWAKIIKEKCVDGTTIEIHVDDSYFGKDGVSRKWVREDIGNYFASGTYGISIFDNTYELFFNTIDSNKPPRITSVKPNIAGLEFMNLLTLNISGRDNGYIVCAPMSYNAALIGDIPSGKQSFRIKGAVPNPALLLGQTLAKELNQLGISTTHVTTSLQDGNIAPEKSKPFHIHRSKPLSQIIRVINEKSNNHYTEHVIRTIGMKDNRTDNPLESGIGKIKDCWKLKGLDTDALFMYDGCGLSPADAISADFMTELLVFMQTKSINSEPFLKSLPIAGREGTVRNFLANKPLRGIVYAKSGSIGDTRCYVGYYVLGETKYAFTIMANKFNGSHNQVARAIENILFEIFKSCDNLN